MKTRLDIIDPCDIQSEIVRKRNEVKISQQTLGNRLNLSKSRVCLIETGHVNLTIHQTEEIFKQMGYSLRIVLTELRP